MRKIILLITICIFGIGSEVNWSSGKSVNEREYKEAVKEYVDKTYPERVREWKSNEKGREYRVIDGLSWQDSYDSKSKKMSFPEAKSYCQNLDLSGYDDWRLPSKNELKKVFHSRSKFKNKTTSFYWTSSTFDPDSGSYGVNFRHGYSYWYENSKKGYVRCVRR